MEKSNINNDLKSGLLSWVIKGVTYKAYVAAVLMFAAGSWKWIAGWVYVIIFLLFDLATALVVFPRSPELLIERSTTHSDAKTWKKNHAPGSRYPSPDLLDCGRFEFTFGMESSP
jgi:hypothetical protein